MPNKAFHHKILLRHQAAIESGYPASRDVCSFAGELLNWLFPEQSGNATHTSAEELELKYHRLETQLQQLLQLMQGKLALPADELTASFFRQLPELDDLLNKDAEAILAGDPAATHRYEVIRTYPGFLALAYYRIAHVLYQLKIPLIPRLITEAAHTKTGIDIHPGARIGSCCCIDHGTGIVIGETSIIGNRVKIYQGVTLGALSVAKDMAQRKRHPTIEDNVVIYAGATILGGDTVVGHDSIIGGNVWLIRSVPPYSRIYYKADEHITYSEHLI